MSSYQGFPYINPVINDVPTIDASKASQWDHLPRRPLELAIPGPSGSAAGPSRDVPSTSGSRPQVTEKKPDDDNPVVYIDVPRPNDSDISTSIETPSIEPEYVQNTFLYDPFENKRIDVKRPVVVPPSPDSEDSDSGRTSPINAYLPPSTQTSANRTPYGTQSQRPIPPAPPIPSFMEKESYIYGGHGSDGFPLSPIPVSEFPEPPPAYTEAPATTPNRPPPQIPSPTPEPPRTQVIVPVPDPASPVGVMSYNRKYLTCQHCHRNVHTIVIRESGYVTYTIALILFCVLMPLILLVFLSDCFKQKNHYCPNCNKLIGYELPLIGTNIHFEKPSNDQ